MLRRHLSRLCFDSSFGRQMRFVCGPRQVGKTTLAKSHLNSIDLGSFYFNWDLRQTRDLYRRDPYFFESGVNDADKARGLPWVCLDEIHKMPKWKNILKDYFDKFEGSCLFIVTGSARLDWFRRSGDSLAGRYFLFRLYPLTLGECVGSSPKETTPGETALGFIERTTTRPRYEQEAVQSLLEFGGFPEPFLRANTAFHRRWQRDMTERVLREDIRDLTRIAEIENLAEIVRLLPGRIGAPLSLNSLKEDIGVSYSAIRNAVSALQFAYVVFMLSPFQRNIARTLKKEKKCYFYDCSLSGDASARFENYVALELKTLTEHWTDSGIVDADLYYVRTKDGRETDFLITIDQKPWCLFEAKTGDDPIASQHYTHSHSLGDIPVVQLTMESKVMRKEGDRFFRISASRFFA